MSSAGGASAADVERRFGFQRSALTAQEIFESEDIDCVVIATRHATHAELTVRALQADKAVFVEKPLALNYAELRAVEAAVAGRVFMVGFNRRFAPLLMRMCAELEGVANGVFTARVNAGYVPSNSWVHDEQEGGGRLFLGEGCHFVDLLAHVAGAKVVRVHAVAVPQPERAIHCSDSFVATFVFGSGSVGSLTYSGSGDVRLPKERIEASGGRSSVVLDDFSRLEIYKGGKRTVTSTRQDKGHAAQFAAFLAAAQGDADLPDASTYINSSRATLAVAESLRTAKAVDVQNLGTRSG